MSVRLIIADTQPATLAGLRAFFQDTDVQVVDSAATAEATLDKTLRELPDALMLDVEFPDGSGFDLVRTLRERGYRGGIVFFEKSGRQTCLARAAAAGANSLILRSSTREEIVAAVLEIAKLGGSEESVKIRVGELGRVAPVMRRRQVDPLGPLTERETQILRHITLGLSNKEIAFSLKLSVDTVKEHVQNILRKLEVSDRTEAAVWAVRNKLIP